MAEAGNDERLLDLADLAWRQGALDRAAQLAGVVLRDDREIAAALRARALVVLAMADTLDGKSGRAYRLMTDAAGVLASVDAEPGVLAGTARAYADLCICAFAVGDEFVMDTMAQVALRHALAEGDLVAEARAWNTSGLSALQGAGTGGRNLDDILGGRPTVLTERQVADVESAHTRFQRANECATAAGDELFVVITAMNLLSTELHRGGAAAVLPAMRAHMHRYEELRSPWSFVGALYELGFAEAEVGNTQAAIATLERALDIAIAEGLKVFVPSLHLGLITLHRRIGDDAGALVWLDRFVASGRRNETGRANLRMLGRTANRGWPTPDVPPSDLFAVDSRRVDPRPSFDPLTGLLARPAFMAWLEALTQRSGRLVLLRLRRFAGVNDLLSVAGGDRVLRTVAARLVEATRGQAAPARMGNTEFAVYLTDDSDPGDLARLLAEPYHVDGRSLTTDVAVGIAHDDPTLDVETLLARADMAVRTVIGRGDTVGVFEPTMSDDLVRNVEIEQALRGANVQEFWLAYQPIVDARTGALLSLEALIRWDSPHLGRLAPGSFIGAAERFGLSDLISEHVVQHLLDDLDQLPPDVSISINCSASEFQRGSALEEMLRVQRFGPLGTRLAVEVTEGAIFRDPAAAAQMIDSLVDLGMDLYLDDFGTGFANFSRLVSWPFAGVKLDRSLVQLLEPDPRMRHLVEAVVLLADSGGMHVVAEGVETAGELQQCVALGCHRIQGYLVAKPMGVWDLQRWMELVRTDPEWSPR